MNKKTERQAQAPTPESYGEGATRRVVLGEIIQHPGTLIPMGVGVVGLLASLALALPVIGTIVAGVVISVGGFNFLYQLLGKGDDYRLRYHQRLHAEFDEIRKAYLDTLQKELTKRVRCSKGARQLALLDEKFGNIQEVIERKLRKGELTHSRFLGAAEELYKNGIKNLEQIVTLLLGIESTETETLAGEVTELENFPKRTVAQDRELNAKRESLKVFTQTRDEVSLLIAENEEALSALDKAAMAVCHIDDDGSSEMQMAMEMLLELTNRKRTFSAVSDGIADMLKEK